MASFRYKAFISYSHADEAWARWLHKALETYRIPKHIVAEKNLGFDRLTPVFRDREELASSDSLSGVIREALAASEFLIVVCSRNAAESRWVDEEIRQFKLRGGAGRVFCLLVDDPKHSFPRSVLTEFDQDGNEVTSDIEPLAADARAEFDGKESAKLKLVAGMIGVGLDQLIRRDAARRQKRLAAIAVAAIVGMGFASALALYAVTQRNLAEQQRTLAAAARDEAITERDRAEAARAEAEEVVEFLIGMYDLFDPGTSLGNEVTAKDVLGRGTENVLADLDEHPRTQARLLTTLGSVYEALGLFDEALELELKAYGIRTAEFGEEHPDVLNSLFALSGVSLNIGDYAALERYARESLRISRKLYGDEHPDSIGALSDLSTAVSGLGNYDLAEQYSSEALAMARASERVETADLEGYVRRAAIYLDMVEKHAEAEPLYKESLELSRQVYGDIHPNVAFALDNLAMHYSDVKKFGQAEPLYWQALDMLRQIYGPEHPEVAQTMGNVASFLIENDGDLGQARKLLEGAIEIDQGIRPNHEFVGDYMGLLADIESKLNNHAAAETWRRESLKVYSASLPPQHPIVISARTSLGGTLLAQDKFDEAEAELLDCYDALVNASSEKKTLAKASEFLVALYERTGSPERADQFRAKNEPARNSTTAN